MTLHDLPAFGSVVLAAMQLVSNLLLSRRSRWGWVLTGTMNAIGLPYDWFTRQYGYLGLFFFNFPVAVRAWVKWGAA